MTMVQVKVSEISGSALDWAVGLCMGWEYRKCRNLTCMGWYDGNQENFRCDSWRPSTEWSHCGKLIELHKVMLCYPTEDGDPWEASCMFDPEWSYGETPQIAACRAIVASKFGDTVSVPAELVEVK